MKHFRKVSILLALTWMSCSTIPSRIQENSERFGAYPAAIQEKIKNGQIDQGFTEEMVYLAKGKPSQILTRQEDPHKIVLWYYSRSEMTAIPGSSDSLSSPYGYPTVGPGPIRPTGVLANRSYLVVKFENSQVAEWTEEPPR